MAVVIAYLDAGSGSMILQAILGGAAGLVVATKMFGSRVKSFLFFWRKDDELEPAVGEPAPAVGEPAPETKSEG